MKPRMRVVVKPKGDKKKSEHPVVICSSVRNEEETVQTPSTVITSESKASDGGAASNVPSPPQPAEQILEETILLVKQRQKERDAQTLKMKLVEVEGLEGAPRRNVTGASTEARSPSTQRRRVTFSSEVDVRIIPRSSIPPPPTYQPVNTMTPPPSEHSMALVPFPSQKPPPPSTSFNSRLPIRRGHICPIPSPSQVVTRNVGTMTSPPPTSQDLVPVRETLRFLRNSPSASTSTSQACLPLTALSGPPLRYCHPMPQITYPTPSCPVAPTPFIPMPPPHQPIPSPMDPLMTSQATALALMPPPPPTVYCPYAPAPPTWVPATSTYCSSSQPVPTHAPPPPAVPTSSTLPQEPVPPGFFTERSPCAPASLPSTSRGDLSLATTPPQSSSPTDVPPPPPDPVPSTSSSLYLANEDLEDICSEEDEPLTSLPWNLRKIYLRKRLCPYRRRSPSREPPLTNTVEFGSEDVKNCENNTKVYNCSKWGWPRPKLEDERHPLQLINVKKRKPEKPSPLAKLHKPPQPQRRRKGGEEKRRKQTIQNTDLSIDHKTSNPSIAFSPTEISY